LGSVLKGTVVFTIPERRKAVSKRYGRYSACCMVTLSFLVLLAGCSREGIQAVGDLVPLQRQLVAEYGESNIKVELQDGSTLGVTFANSASTDLAWDQKAQQAGEIASFVCNNYASMGRIIKVRVAFETDQDGFIGDSTSSTAFVFDQSELECGDK
jgi:hypothetical protein